MENHYLCLNGMLDGTKSNPSHGCSEQLRLELVDVTFFRGYIQVEFGM